MGDEGTAQMGWRRRPQPHTTKAWWSGWKKLLWEAPKRTREKPKRSNGCYMGPGGAGSVRFLTKPRWPGEREQHGGSLKVSYRQRLRQQGAQSAAVGPGRGCFGNGYESTGERRRVERGLEQKLGALLAAEPFCGESRAILSDGGADQERKKKIELAFYTK